jgi:hypothetical protein
MAHLKPISGMSFRTVIGSTVPPKLEPDASTPNASPRRARTMIKTVSAGRRYLVKRLTPMRYHRNRRAEQEPRCELD